MFGLATNFNSFSGSTKDIQLHCQFGTRKYLSSQVEITEFLVQLKCSGLQEGFIMNPGALRL